MPWNVLNCALLVTGRAPGPRAPVGADRYLQACLSGLARARLGRARARGSVAAAAVRVAPRESLAAEDKRAVPSAKRGGGSAMR